MARHIENDGLRLKLANAKGGRPKLYVSSQPCVEYYDSCLVDVQQSAFTRIFKQSLTPENSRLNSLKMVLLITIPASWQGPQMAFRALKGEFYSSYGTPRHSMLLIWSAKATTFTGFGLWRP